MQFWQKMPQRRNGCDGAGALRDGRLADIFSPKDRKPFAVALKSIYPGSQCRCRRRSLLLNEAAS
jgi:hypothetical protein